MTLEELYNSKQIIFESIVGSHLYGLNTETSDLDKKGVFIVPQEKIYGFKYQDQISDEKNDVNFLEIGKFLHLLKSSNPNILELLFAPDEFIIQKHPIFDLILQHKHKFLTKQCKNSLIGYSYSQVAKAKGLKKKAFNPIDKERKTPLDFCYVVVGSKSVPVKKWLANKNVKQEYCGLVDLKNMHNLYSIFHDVDFQNYTGNSYISTLEYKGMIKESSENTFPSNQLRLSSIPKSEKPIGTMYYNSDGYSRYCKEYSEYWEWVEKRNEARYTANIKSGGDVDNKNMMHCHRLINMGLELGKTGTLNVKRTDDRQFLMDVRNGKYKYQELTELAKEKIKEMDSVFDNSNLPDEVDPFFLNELLVQIRNEFYK